ncbi:MAG: fibronectin type III domain-containing protein [Spirochaetaceae bacterium]|jgi:hypothetical protein|nr:fibronectin type III domain-containing protein [Spirochaetaceae bacterium]
MKTKNKIYGILAAIAAAMALSCQQPDGLAGGPAVKGTVVLTASAGSGGGGPVQKTIFPEVAEDVEFDRYVLVFSRDGFVDIPFNSDDNADLAYDLNNDGYSLELDAGTWTATVTAYRKFTINGESEEYEAARGAKDFTVTAGTLLSVSVDIAPIPIDAEAGEDLKGIFTYKVTFPEGASGVLTLGDEEPITLTESMEASDSIEIAHGSYNISISLTNGDLSAGVSEKLHIYAGFESKVEFEFENDDFIKNVYFEGPLSSLVGDVGIKSGTIAAYSDKAHTKVVFTEQLTVSAGGWIVGVAANDVIGKELYLKAEVTGSDDKTYLGAGDTGGKVPEKGIRGIALKNDPPEDVSSLTRTLDSGKVTLTWKDPADLDLDHIEISYNSEGETPKTETVDKGANTKDITGLTDKVSYTFTVKAVDTLGNKSEGKSLTGTPIVTWTAAADGAANTTTSTKITFTFSSPITGLSASNITVLNSPGKVGKGEVTGSDKSWQLELATVITAGSVQVSINDEAIEIGYKSVTVYKDSTAPAVVTGLTAAIGSEKVTLAWTDPKDADFDHVEISWTPASGTESIRVEKDVQTATVEGLNNTTLYTFSVKAVDKAGNQNATTVTGMPLSDPQAKVEVTFTGPVDEAIDLTAPEDGVSQDGAMSVTVDTTYTSYKWALDGVVLADKTGNSLSLSASQLSIGKHTLTVIVTKDSVPYSKSVTFMVTADAGK